MFSMLFSPKVLSSLVLHTPGDHNHVNGLVLSVPQIYTYTLAFSPTHQIHANNWPIIYPRNAPNSTPLSISMQLWGKSELMTPDCVWTWQWRKNQSLCVPGHQSCTGSCCSWQDGGVWGQPPGGSQESGSC